MVREIAVFRTQEGQTEAFVEVYGGVAKVLAEADGGRGRRLRRDVEVLDSFVPRPCLAGQPGVRYAEAVA